MSMSISAAGSSAAQTAENITVAQATAAARTPIDAAQDSSAGVTASGIASEQQEPVRHFPWLSRLTAQLDSSATQKSPFAAAPFTGETLNQSA